jgi:hypothetical protein
MFEVRVRDVAVIIEVGSAPGEVVGIDLLSNERGELFNRIVAEVLTPENRREAMVAQLVFAGHVPVVVPGVSDQVVARVVGRPWSRTGSDQCGRSRTPLPRRADIRQSVYDTARHVRARGEFSRTASRGRRRRRVGCRCEPIGHTTESPSRSSPNAEGSSPEDDHHTRHAGLAIAVGSSLENSIGTARTPRSFVRYRCYDCVMRATIAHVARAQRSSLLVDVVRERAGVLVGRAEV